MIFATGFAPFTGGPMHYLETRGRDAVLQRLSELEEKFGERFQPDAGWQRA
jgi:3-hydroxyacyl-CoA dehydrogenase/enoyl-CoA hydratase/3-hydroxybutyryl-CoA epimerase